MVKKSDDENNIRVRGSVTDDENNIRVRVTEMQPDTEKNSPEPEKEEGNRNTVETSEYKPPEAAPEKGMSKYIIEPTEKEPKFERVINLSELKDKSGNELGDKEKIKEIKKQALDLYYKNPNENIIIIDDDKKNQGLKFSYTDLRTVLRNQEDGITTESFLKSAEKAIVNTIDGADSEKSARRARILFNKKASKDISKYFSENKGDEKHKILKNLLEKGDNLNKINSFRVGVRLTGYLMERKINLNPKNGMFSTKRWEKNTSQMIELRKATSKDKFIKKIDKNIEGNIKDLSSAINREKNTRRMTSINLDRLANKMDNLEATIKSLPKDSSVRQLAEAKYNNHVENLNKKFEKEINDPKKANSKRYNKLKDAGLFKHMGNAEEKMKAALVDKLTNQIENLEKKIEQKKALTQDLEFMKAKIDKYKKDGILTKSGSNSTFNKSIKNVEESMNKIFESRKKDNIDVAKKRIDSFISKRLDRQDKNIESIDDFKKLAMKYVNKVCGKDSNLAKEIKGAIDNVQGSESYKKDIKKAISTKLEDVPTKDSNAIFEASAKIKAKKLLNIPKLKLSKSSFKMKRMKKQMNKEAERRGRASI
jgi:hypothetical protein